jgi:CDP-glycerol glycerophosphotransferase
MGNNTELYWKGRIEYWAPRVPRIVGSWLFILFLLTAAGHWAGILINKLSNSQLVGRPLTTNLIPFVEQPNLLSYLGAATALVLILALNVRLQRLFSIPILILNLPIYAVSGFLSKKPDRWLFCARQGKAFAENCKYLFIHVHNEQPDLEAIWITHDRSIKRDLLRQGFKACMAYSPAGYWYSLTAGAVFLSHNRIWDPDGNGFAIARGTLIMQLWHGSPIKRLGNTVEWSTDSKLSIVIGKILIALFPFLAIRRYCHRMLAACPSVARHLGESYAIPDTNMLISGYPKNDSWLGRALSTKNTGPRKVIYMPTFRALDWRLFVDFECNFERLNRLCSKHNMEFHIKLHPYSLDRLALIMESISALTHIKFCDHDDIYEILDEYDVLVTDYSSISFDYLLCGRPIIYAPFDYASYKKEERGFLEPYKSLTPGPHARNWPELEALMVSKVDEYASQRKALNDRYNSYQSSHSSERLVEQVRALIKDGVGNSRPVGDIQF